MSVKDKLGTAVRKLVTLQEKDLGVVCDLLEKYSDPEWVEATKRMLRKEPPWPQGTKPKPSDLLEPLKTVELPEVKVFKAKEAFTITPDQDRKTAKVIIGYISDNFRNAFLEGDGKIEENIPEAKLRIFKLKKASVDGPIIADLGGESVVETTLAEMFEAMKLQGHGQKGALLTNGYANIFYIRDTEGNLWAVSCRWRSDDECWVVRAFSITNPTQWNAGSRVLVRDSGS